MAQTAHTHPYEEIFVIVEGKGQLEAGGEVLDTTPDQICIVPAGVPHTFTNPGPGRARLVNIHTAGQVVTEFTDDDPPSTLSYEDNQPS